MNEQRGGESKTVRGRRMGEEEEEEAKLRKGVCEWEWDRGCSQPEKIISPLLFLQPLNFARALNL